MDGTEKSKTLVWTAQLVEEHKAAVKHQLDKIADEYGLQARLDFIFEQLEFLKKDGTELGTIRQIIFCISALFHHGRHGGLLEYQINSLKDLATSLLISSEVAPQRSKLSFLFGDLHLALTKVHFKEGAHWPAAWEHNMAFQLSKAAQPGGEAHLQLTGALRSLRLGNAAIAIRDFQTAEGTTLTNEQFEFARLGRIKACRMTGDLSGVKNLCNSTLSDPRISERGQIELQWELVCCQVSEERNLKPMMRLIKKGRSHYVATYIVETFFWAISLASNDKRLEIESMEKLAKRTELNPQALGLFFEFARVLERSHDAEVPYVSRLNALGKIAKNAGKLLSIDKELLLWVSLARWLAKNRNTDLAALALTEYRKLSLSLSEGQNPDVLGIAKDLLDRDWFPSASSQISLKSAG